jgi:hypothetical protein
MFFADLANTLTPTPIFKESLGTIISGHMKLDELL